MMVRPPHGKRAVVHYRATLDDGTVLDSSFGGKPLKFNLGRFEVIPLFERAVLEMDRGEVRQFRISAEELLASALESLAILSEESSFSGKREMEPDRPLLKGREIGSERIPALDLTEIGNGEEEGGFEHPPAGEDIIFEIHLLDILDEEEDG